MRKFSLCSVSVKCRLFKAYCYQLYGGNLWVSYTANVLRKLKVGYNNAARIILGYDRRSSSSSMFVTNRIDSFDALLRKQMYGLMKRLSVSNNVIVRKVTDTLYFTSDLRRLWLKSVFL